MKRILIGIIAVMLLFSGVLTVSADSAKSYIYNKNNEPNRVLDPYTASRVYGTELKLQEPQDMVVNNDEIYILDSGNSEIKVISAKSYEFLRTIEFKKNNEPYSTFNLTGFCVDGDTILVVDYDNKTIFRTDMSGNVLQEYTDPIEGNSNVFMPKSVAVDATGHIYICLELESRGLMVIDKDGTYKNFFGSVDIATTSKVLLNMFWRRFMTEEQIQKSEQNVPGGYNSVASDNNGFIYAVRGAAESNTELINKLNSGGKNVLKFKGSFGDSNTEQSTNFVSVAVDNNDMIAALDAANKHIFFYSPEGELLYIFGAKSLQNGTNNAVQTGTFLNPVDIEFNGKDLLVLDKSTGTITVFNTTKFGSMVQEATILHSKARFDEASEIWNEVLMMCSNYEKAYTGIGKICEASGDYKEAMENYRVAGDVNYYSSAFKKYRTELIKDNFYLLVGILVVTIVAFVLINRARAKKEKVSLEVGGPFRYYLYTMRHPFDGFSELRYNKKFSGKTALILLILYFFISCLNYNYNGYIFNGDAAENFNLFVVFLSTIGVVLLFTLSAWLLTTFLEGKGNLKEIFICSCYSLTPIIIVSAFSLILTNVLSLDEAFFGMAVETIGTALTLIYIFISNGALNQYSFKKNICSLLLTVIGMLIIVFLIFLFISLFTQVKGFIETLISEINYRRLAFG